MKITKFSDPFPHLVVKDVIPEDIYRTLKFPQLQKREATRAGWDLFKGEPGYDEFFASDNGWTKVRQLLDSQEFLLLVLNEFREELAEIDVNPDELALIDYVETPAQMRTGTMVPGKFDKRIYSRFDLQASDGSTLRVPHVDAARRLVGGVLFFCDGDEEQLDGGEFGLWVDDDFRNDRVPHATRIVQTLPVKHNTMYIFLNRNDAFHAPTALKSAVGMRQWAYFSISGVQNVWKSKRDQGIRGIFNRARDVKQRLEYHMRNA